MSVIAAPTSPPTAGAAPPPDHCLHCTAPLASDQEWCLECGAARTYVHRPPDWRVPAAIVAGVIALALAGFAIALINLSSSANRSTPVATGQARAPSRPPAHAAAPTTPKFAGWPAGLPGWTVSLASRRTQAIAQRVATKLAAEGITVGILNGNQYPSLKTNRWIVFSGRYPTQAAAQAKAAVLIAKDGHARARLVAPPGA